ncbi:MAG TPA: EAL domain-containing protein [Rhodocyclaceae bacterium]|nr:EAL domain-containing protein [Rhodocyclaceae bacterium]
MPGSMILERRVFLIIASVMAVVLIAFEAISYQRLEREAEAELLASAERVRNVLMAMRRVYHHQFLDSGMPIDDKTIGLLPAVALSKISEELPNWDNSGFSFNNVSDRPRNPRNRADAIEMVAIEHFQQHPDEKLRFISFVNEQNQAYYHYARPIWVEPYCLECHGAREKAPETIRAKYAAAYDYKVGELRGIMSIKVSAQHVRQQIVDEFRRHLLWHLGLFILLSLAMAWTIRRYLGRPLARLHGSIGAIAGGNLAARVESLPGEFDEIGKTFNNMATTIEADREDLAASEERLRAIAYHDPLTHLPNRMLFFDRLQLAQAQSARNGRLLAVCYLDLDGFKTVNDAYGHNTGDRLLREAAQRLRDAVRAGDTVARLGGDEFGLLLGELSGIEEVEQTLNRVLSVIAVPYRIDSHSLTLSASIGVTLLPDGDELPEHLLRLADEAMYLAKAAGRNCFRLFNAEQNQLMQRYRADLERIRAGVAANEFALYYLPKINVRQGKVVGLEAVLCWRHPTEGLLLPARFAGNIEDSDLAVPTGKWVIQEALRQSAAWSQAGLDIPLSVNISPKCLEESDIAAWLVDAVNTTAGLKPDLFGVEIAEEIALAHSTTVSGLVEQCHPLGLRVALDGFGVAYTSLTYLKRLGVDEIKIAAGLTHDMLDSSDVQAIVRGIVGLGHAFGLTVIAEGLEEPEQGMLLAQYDCEIVQKAASEAITAEAVPAWLAAFDPAVALADYVLLKIADADVPLLTARVTHRRWLQRLAAYVAGTKPLAPTLLGDHTQCKLGRWFEGAGRDRYGHMAAYSTIEPIHRDFHVVGNGVIELMQAGDKSAAETRLADLKRLSIEILASINDLLIEAAISGDR